MFDWFFSMDISTRVNAILATLSFALAVISVVAIIITLRQNHKMIENATRPYIVIYYDAIQTLSTVTDYLVLKNFGNSGATIDSIDIAPPFKLHPSLDMTPFGTVKGTFLAPGQLYTTSPFEGNRHTREKCSNRTFLIRYHTDKKTYEEKIVINEHIVDSMVFKKVSPSSSQSVQKVVANVAEEILRRGL